MRLFDKVFSKQINHIAEEKAMQQLNEVRFQGEDQYYNMLFRTFLSNGMYLLQDGGNKSAKDAFKSSTDVYSIISKIVTYGSQVEWEVYDNDKEIEDENHPIKQFLKKPNKYQSYTELYEEWHFNHLLYGNGIVYYPTQGEGNNKGKLIQGAFNIPSNVVSIESGGVLEPIKFYNVEYNLLPSNSIEVKDIIHTRMLNVFELGSNLFWGLSPISVAANVVSSQINGIKKLANIFNNGIPPGMLTRIFSEAELNSSNPSLDSREKFNSEWRKRAKDQTPFMGTGKHEWLQFGSNLVKDLQIIESMQNGTSILCSIYGVPDQLFNISTGQKFDNMESAERQMWEGRIIPDQFKWCEKLNEKIKVAYPTVEVWPDYTHIKALQNDLGKASTTYTPAFQNKTMTVNEYREKLGLPPIDGEIGNSYYGPMGLTIDPIDKGNDLLEANKFLDNNNVNDYKK